MFPSWKERELQTVQTSNDDDDAGGNYYQKSNLDCIIEASLVDDLGANSAALERIVKFFRAWHNRRVGDRPVGRSENLRTIQMAPSQITPKREIREPELSSNG